VPSTVIRAVLWNTSGETARGSAQGSSWRAPFDQLSAIAAGLLLMVSTGATILEQSAADNDQTSDAVTTSGGGSSRSIPGNETIVGAFSGTPYTYPSKVKLGTRAESFTIDPVHWYTDPFHNPIYYGVRVLRWGDSFGTMVDFIHSKAIAEQQEEASFSGTLDGKPLPERARIHDVVPKFEFSHGHNMLLFTGLARLPGIGARIRPYTGIGAGVLLPHTEVGLAAPGHHRTYEYNFAGPAAQALFGLEFRLARVSLFVEYKFTWGHYEAPLSQVDGSWLFEDLWRQLQRWRRGEEPAGGHVQTEIVSHQAVGGLMVRVGPRP
jgi:lipid A oxidase